MKIKSILNRFTALFLITVFLFTVIIARLFYLQIVSASEYEELANSQAVRYISDFAPRGQIVDRNGEPFASNLQSYNIVFMETEESRRYFFDTFKKVFDILESSERINDLGMVEKEKLQDDFELKVNPYRFEFKSDDPKIKQLSELRFKKDRGFHYKLEKRLFKNKKGDLTNSEKTLIEEEVLKVTPEEAFYELVVQYGLYKLLKLDKEEQTVLLRESTPKEITERLLEDHNVEEIRKFMLIKDALKMQSFSGFKPVTVASNIDRNTAFIFEQLKHDLPGIDITMQPVRYYPNKEIGANFIGYISRISGDKKDRYEERGYDVSADYIGAAGLESAFEDRLRGSKGYTTVKVNKHGRRTDVLFRLDPYPGQKIVLTVDKTLQYVAERALTEEMLKLQATRKHGKDTVDTGNATRGAAVVLDVNTGAVLAMASNPSYDPNLFAVPGRLTDELFKQYFAPDLTAFGESYIERLGLKDVTVDKLFPIDTSVAGGIARKDFYDIYPKPFYNYASSSLIPPGSTFKPLTAIAGLEEGVISENTKIYDAQVFDEHGKDTNDYKGACWMWNEHKSSHGSIDVKKALEVSCNYFFFEIGYRLYKNRGLDSLAKYAWGFGLGVDPKCNIKPTTGIEIFENFGQVYNEQSRRNNAAVNAIDVIESILSSGVYIPGEGPRLYFSPLSISDNALDNDSLKESKRNFKYIISKNIKAEESYKDLRKQYEVTRNDIKPAVNRIIENLPDDVKNSYNKEDINNMVEAIAIYITFDVKTMVITPANMYDASIGQGINRFTPLQMANYIATFVNGGNRYRLHLVERFEDPNGQLIEEIKPEIVEKIQLNDTTISTVLDGMRLVTGEDGTAAKALNDFPIKTGGKTGSATYSVDQERVGRTSYGIYVGFAPIEKPEIAVCVVIFDGGHGGFVAPVARAIYETYFREDLKKNHTSFNPMYNYTLEPEKQMNNSLK
jgi:penicillin-binding protein 2